MRSGSALCVRAPFPPDLAESVFKMFREDFGLAEGRLPEAITEGGANAGQRIKSSRPPKAPRDKILWRPGDKAVQADMLQHGRPKPPGSGASG